MCDIDISMYLLLLKVDDDDSDKGTICTESPVNTTNSHILCVILRDICVILCDIMN